MFQVELCVTDKCNLGCRYCYSANKNKFMTFETFMKNLPRIREYTRNAGYDKYNLSFFGGEPLLNFELIKQIVPVVQKDPMCNFCNIISNMTLMNDEIYDFIKTNRIATSWSFDGKDSIKSRPLLQMSENKGFKNILEMYESQKEHLLDLAHGFCKVMIYPGNIATMVENFEFFLDYGLNEPDYTLVRDDIWTNKDILLFKKYTHELANAYIEKVKSGVNCTIGFFRLYFLDALYASKYHKRNHGCFAGTCGCALTPDGKFYPCQRFSVKHAFEMERDHNFQEYTKMFSPRNYEKCKKCDLYYVCNCGCTYSQIMNNNQPLDSICELFHILMEETIRITHALKDNELFMRITKHWCDTIG